MCQVGWKKNRFLIHSLEQYNSYLFFFFLLLPSLSLYCVFIEHPSMHEHIPHLLMEKIWWQKMLIEKFFDSYSSSTRIKRHLIHWDDQFISYGQPQNVNSTHNCHRITHTHIHKHIYDWIIEIETIIRRFARISYWPFNIWHGTFFIKLVAGINHF